MNLKWKKLHFKVGRQPMNNQYKFYSSTTQEYGTIGWMVRIHFPFNISAVLWKDPYSVYTVYKSMTISCTSAISVALTAVHSSR